MCQACIYNLPLHICDAKRLLFYCSSWKTRTQKTKGNNSAGRNLRYSPQKKRKVVLLFPLSPTPFFSLSYKISIYVLFHDIANLNPSESIETFLIRMHNQPSGYQQKCVQKNRHPNHTERRTISPIQQN